jgi:hypothetical protein
MIKKPLSILFFGVLLFSAACLGQEEIDPKLTEIWEPVPSVVTPGAENAPPSDAFVLFDGSTLDGWRSAKGGQAKWTVRDSCITVVPGTGDIVTENAFGDVQLHVEFRCPLPASGTGQGRGNSGVFLQGLYEVQVLDSYVSATYVNGQCGSIYKQYAPLVNACRPPGEWQTFDIVYLAPRFTESGTLLLPGTMTVFQNGVLIQNHVEIRGATTWRGQPKMSPHPLKLPLKLQEHKNPVSYRNIWLREL